MKPLLPRGLLLAALIGLTTAATAATRLPDPTYFRIQMELGDLERAREWLDAGLDPEMQGDILGSGLMIGAWEGNIALMELFHARGAAIDRPNRLGETALMLAAWKGHDRAVQWLLDRGANARAGANRWSPLHYAVFAGRREIARSLVARGADIDARSSNGSSVLMMAIYEGHEDLAEWLLDQGADPRTRNDWGDGALEWAMKFGHTRIARRVADAPSFAAAASRPKADWGVAQRSLPAEPPPPPPADSEELRRLLELRALVAERKLDVGKIDTKIAAERVRIHRAAVARDALPPATTTALEIRARRAAPTEQKARIVVEPR